MIAAEFVRPADTVSYSAGDVVSNSTSATTLQPVQNIVVAPGRVNFLIGARLTTDKKSITPRFRVHLYNAATPTVAVDNDPMIRKYADEAKYLGSFDLPAMTTGADTTNSDESQAQDLALRIPFQTAGGKSIYYVLETLDAFAPASGQRFVLRLVSDLH